MNRTLIKSLLVAAGAVAAVSAVRAVARSRRAIDLDGKVVFITGGSRGLGYLLAEEFAARGARVAICARDAAELDRAQQDLRSKRLDAMTVTCDVGNRDQVERAIGEVRTALGAIDVLVNNAGVIQVGPIGTMTVQDFHDAMDVMYWGVVYPSLAVLPDMLRRRGGSIVNITSIGAKASMPHLLPYNAAKFAALGFSEGLRAEVGREGVRVTTIAPGLMRTGSYRRAWFKGNEEGEYAWFSAASSLPLLSMSARRAARRIVEATVYGESEVILSVPAKLLAMFHGLFPGATADILSFVDRALPKTVRPGDQRMLGEAAEASLDSRVHRQLTRLGRSAANRYQH